MFKSINPLYKLSYKTAVDTQIDLYKKFKFESPSYTKEEWVLNELINSRVRSELMLPEFSQKDPKAFYAETLERKDKTLTDVILSIVYFEFIESRRDSLKGLGVEDRLNFMERVAAYTAKQIAKMKK